MIPPRGETRAVTEAEVWQTGSRPILLDHPIIVGIVNVTPDSFSDGGDFFAPADAIRHGRKLVDDGADVLDVGGESTRPGAVAISAAVESERVLPVIEGIRAAAIDVAVSVDTTKAEVARRALQAGADIVNDVSAARLDDSMPALLASADCGVVLMHSRGSVEEMATYQHADYEGDPLTRIAAEISGRARMLEAAGVASDRIVIDPGIGFSKHSEVSISLLRDLEEFRSLGYPILVGPSRKRFVREILEKASGRPVTNEDRDLGTVGASVVALMAGARIFRVHDVWSHRRALDVAWAILNKTN